MSFKKIFFAAVIGALVSSHVFAQNDAVISDAAINAHVKNRITSDRSLGGTSISISTADGVVSLTGNVDSDTQADAATELAQATPGVRDVDTSNLTVKGSDHPVADAMITAKVKGMFIQQKLFGDKDVAAMTIKVETNNGVVSLSGTADNQDQANNAIKIAKSVAGVKDVKSTITISNTISNS